jgi:hypothetical protein
MLKAKVNSMYLKEILLNLKLIEKHTYNLKIKNSDFEEKLIAITEFKFNPFSKMIFKGKVNQDIFELVLFSNIRKGAFGAVAKGTYFELNESLIVNIEIWGVDNSQFVYFFFFIIGFLWFGKMGFGIEIMFIIFFLFPFMYFELRSNIKSLKHSLKQEFNGFVSKS